MSQNGGEYRQRQTNEDTVDTVVKQALLLNDTHGQQTRPAGGIHNVSMQGVTKDYLKINFQGKDSLFVPVTQLDLISRYSYAQSDEKVTLSKLGGESWKKTKAKAKKATGFQKRRGYPEISTE